MSWKLASSSELRSSSVGAGTDKSLRQKSLAIATRRLRKEGKKAGVACNLGPGRHKACRQYQTENHQDGCCDAYGTVEDFSSLASRNASPHRDTFLRTGEAASLEAPQPTRLKLL